MIHDYHLYAAPLFIRGAYPRAYLQHFVHIPWPTACEWTYLPDLISASICTSLIANDSVVFHTQSSVTNFLETVATYIPTADIDYDAGVITHGAHQTHVWANPVSVDVDDLLDRLDDPELEQAQRKFDSAPGIKTIVRVDRLDPSKNIAKGFQAFEYLLERYPEWRGKARFLAFLVPTRGGIAEYQRHALDVLHQAEAINARFGDEHWKPITIFYQQNRMQALAALSLYDVLMVNSVVDGLNLVSKEGAVLNQRDGVLVLSKGVGSYQELHDYALGIDPYDVAGTASALNDALQMSTAERQRRAEGMRAVIERHQFTDWLELMLHDVPSPTGDAPMDDNGDSRPLATAGVQ
jgi:trehalose 6-phosphate synthase